MRETSIAYTQNWLSCDHGSHRRAAPRYARCTYTNDTHPPSHQTGHLHCKLWQSCGPWPCFQLDLLPWVGFSVRALNKTKGPLPGLWAQDLRLLRGWLLESALNATASTVDREAGTATAFWAQWPPGRSCPHNLASTALATYTRNDLQRHPASGSHTDMALMAI